MNYIQFWHETKYVLFSILLSSVVVTWDVIFVLDHFTANKFLAVVMMIAVELSYIVLPYMQDQEPARTGKKKSKRKLPTFNQVMIVIFFVSSMTPAALQISGQFLGKMVNAVRVEPTKPEKPGQDENIDRDIQIYRYRVYKEINLTESQAKLNDLEKIKSDYRGRIADYEKAVSEYPGKMEAYQEFKAKGRLTWFFDVAMLVIGFVTMISLQVMNGYSSKKGASVKKLAVANIPEIQVSEQEPDPEPEKNDEPDSGFRPY